MENPESEIKDVVRGLVRKPTFSRQEAVLRKYFAPDCTFNHFYLDVESGGVENLIAIYQIGQSVLQYQDVDFYDIAYDASKQRLSVRMGVHIRPWTKFCTSATLNMFVLLELEDFQAEDGRTLKRIKTQRDYFIRSPLLLCLPIIGDVYDSGKWRAWLGSANAVVFRAFRNVVFKKSTK